MSKRACHLAAAVAFLTMALACLPPLARAQSAPTLIEFSAEARFQLDLHVNETALAALLPPGFTPNVATQGPAKDCNLRAIFVDRMTINGPDGKPVGKVTSGLLSPTLNVPIAMGYVPTELSANGTLLHAMVRGKSVPMVVSSMPFVPNRYYRGPAA